MSKELTVEEKAALKERLKPPSKNCQLRFCIPPPPYKDLGEKYQAIIEYIFCNERRKDAGYKEESLDKLADFMGSTVEELVSIKYSAEFSDILRAHIKKGSILEITVLGPLANTVIKKMLASEDAGEQKRGLEYYLKYQEQLGIKEVDIRRDFTAKTNADELLMDLCGMLGTVIKSSMNKECTCGAYIDPIRFLEAIKKEGPAYLERTIQEDVVEDLGEAKRGVGAGPERPNPAVRIPSSPRSSV